MGYIFDAMNRAGDEPNPRRPQDQLRRTGRPGSPPPTPPDAGDATADGLDAESGATPEVAYVPPTPAADAAPPRPPAAPVAPQTAAANGDDAPDDAGEILADLPGIREDAIAAPSPRPASQATPSVQTPRAAEASTPTPTPPPKSILSGSFFSAAFSTRRTAKTADESAPVQADRAAAADEITAVNATPPAAAEHEVESVEMRADPVEIADSQTNSDTGNATGEADDLGLAPVSLLELPRRDGYGVLRLQPQNVDDRLIALCEPTAYVAEEYRAIRTTLLARWEQRRNLVHTITSATPKEGKTITSLNLGASFAELRNRRTIVIEADLRLPQFQNLLDLPDGPGLVDVLQGEATLDDAIRIIDGVNLAVLAAGRRADVNAVQLLSGRQMAQTLDALRQRFDHVVIDTPPVVELADAGILGAMSDDVMLIVRMQVTPQTLVEQAIRTLKSYNAPVAGVIATDQPRNRQSAYYSRYGYHYGGYRSYRSYRNYRAKAA